MQLDAAANAQVQAVIPDLAVQHPAPQGGSFHARTWTRKNWKIHNMPPSPFSHGTSSPMSAEAKDSQLLPSTFNRLDKEAARKWNPSSLPDPMDLSYLGRRWIIRLRSWLSEQYWDRGLSAKAMTLSTNSPTRG
ncbi:MAG: hypothetical protein U5J83_13615 [Bryobacterales bacterium]|nr:hypothetical protein [Bryobacterales bacterium]